MYRLSYLFLLAAALFLMVIYDLYAAFLLSIVLLLVPPLSLSWGFLAKRSISCTLTAPSAGQRGKPMEAMVSVKGWMVPFLSSLTAFLQDREYDAWEESGQEIRFYFHLDMAHCGRLSLDGGQISWQDPFRLFHFHQSLTPVTVVVLPQKVGRVSTILHSLLSLASSDEVEYFGATEYKPGDNPHLINWKITARREEVYVRDSMPADHVRIALAADYAHSPDDRDTLGDALYSAGLALVTSHMPFRFAWATEKGRPLVEIITTQEEWKEALLSFLRMGGDHALTQSPLSPYLPICYLTDTMTPAVSPQLHPTIWCSQEGAKGAALSGKSAIYHGLGGQPA